MESCMENHIVNTSINYRLNESLITARSVNAVDKTYAVEVSEVFGQEVSWKLTSFRIVDVYEYFENEVIEDIMTKLFCDSSIMQAYCEKFEQLTNWMQERVKDEVHSELHDQFTQEFGIYWNVFSENVLSEMGRAGFLSSSLYHSIIAGYFECVARRYFNIQIEDANYSKHQNNGLINIEFSNKYRMKTKTEDFFIGSDFFDQLTKKITTDVFLDNIRRSVGAALCNQRIS